MMYETRIETEMIIDHEKEKVSLEQLKIKVNGYENQEIERKAIDAYNKDEELSKYTIEVDGWLKRFWYRIFDDMFDKLRYWPQIIRKKKI